MMTSSLWASVSKSVHDLHRRVIFGQAMRQFMADPRKIAERPGSILNQLVIGWGNSGWSGAPEYLQECILHALQCKGPILECGSGLTTLLVGQIAALRGLSMWSLEHMPEWAVRVRNALDQYAITSVNLCSVPIRNYGAFDWYDVPLHTMPERFLLVICDGPPSNTRGGRYGMVPIMRDRLPAGCTVLLDDASRTEETRIAADWASGFDMSLERRGVIKPYFVLTRP